MRYGESEALQAPPGVSLRAPERSGLVAVSSETACKAVSTGAQQTRVG